MNGDQRGTERTIELEGGMLVVHYSETAWAQLEEYQAKHGHEAAYVVTDETWNDDYTERTIKALRIVDSPEGIR